MEHDNDQEGMSNSKKALAGAAVGIAVPAAVTVALQRAQHVRRHQSQQPHEGAAVQPGEAPEDSGPLEHDEAAARARHRPRDLVGGGPRSGAGLWLHPRLQFPPLSTVPR